MARTKMKKIKKCREPVLVHCTFLNGIYHPMKFKDHSFYAFGEMHWTKVKYKN
jgi:hypothetical protein